MATFYKDDNNILVRDQNRYRKIYRYIRKKPRLLQCEGDEISHFQWGTYLVEFKDQSEVAHTFPCCYSTSPAVVASSVVLGTAQNASEVKTPAKVSYLTFGELIPQTASAFVGITGGSITSIIGLTGGFGYVTAPTVTVTGGGGSGANITATVSGGRVVSLNIISGGSSFTSAPAITIAPPPELDSTDTIVGMIGNTERAEIEKGFIDLKNADGSISRVRFNDTVAPDGFAAHSNKPTYGPGITVNEVSVDISDVGHYGLGLGFTGGDINSVEFRFEHPPGTPTVHLDATYSLSSSVNGVATLSSLLSNLWWDFRNNPLDSNSVWRVEIAGGGNYPADHSNTRSRTPDKVFSISPTGSNLGDWLTSFENLLSTTTVGGAKFTDRWKITATKGIPGVLGATLKFESKLGNRGQLQPLTSPTPALPGWYDAYSKAFAPGEPGNIMIQTQVQSGDNTETTNQGLITKIVNTVNANATFNSKWTASASVNSVERLAFSKATSTINSLSFAYETFILTFTATNSNSGEIAHITDTGAGTNPGSFYHDSNHYNSINNVVGQVSHLFRLDSTSLYGKERYIDLNQNPPDPLPIISANGTTTPSGVAGFSVPSNPNHNVYVTDITPTGCIFRTSGYYTGFVHYQALEPGVYSMPNIGKSLEVVELQFNGTDDFVTHPFVASFGCVPIVTVTADKDVNAFVVALSKTAVTVEVSMSGYKGKVYLQAIEKGC